MGDLDSADKIDQANKRYLTSEKGKATVKKYQRSEKGKDSRERYLKSEKGKQAQLRYRLSPKGQEAIQKKKETNVFLAECAKWVEENPGKTATDFLTYLKEQP